MFSKLCPVNVLTFKTRTFSFLRRRRGLIIIWVIFVIIWFLICFPNMSRFLHLLLVLTKPIWHLMIRGMKFSLSSLETLNVSLRWRMRSKLLRTPSGALYVTSLLVCGHFLNFRSNAKTQRNNYRMTECTHVPKRPFYSQNTSGCQSFLILDGLVSQSDVVVVVDGDDVVVVVVANNIGGATGGSTVGRAKLRSSTSVGELVSCGFFSSTVLRFCIKSLISKLLLSPASLSKFCRKDICGSNWTL